MTFLFKQNIANSMEGTVIGLKSEKKVETKVYSHLYIPPPPGGGGGGGGGCLEKSQI